MLVKGFYLLTLCLNYLVTCNKVIHKDSYNSDELYDQLSEETQNPSVFKEMLKRERSGGSPTHMADERFFSHLLQRSKNKSQRHVRKPLLHSRPLKPIFKFQKGGKHRFNYGSPKLNIETSPYSSFVSQSQKITNYSPTSRPEDSSSPLKYTERITTGNTDSTTHKAVPEKFNSHFPQNYESFKPYHIPSFSFEDLRSKDEVFKYKAPTSNHFGESPIYQETSSSHPSSSVHYGANNYHSSDEISTSRAHFYVPPSTLPPVINVSPSKQKSFGSKGPSVSYVNSNSLSASYNTATIHESSYSTEKSNEPSYNSPKIKSPPSSIYTKPALTYEAPFYNSVRSNHGQSYETSSLSYNKHQIDTSYEIPKVYSSSVINPPSPEYKTPLTSSVTPSDSIYENSQDSSYSRPSSSYEQPHIDNSYIPPSKSSPSSSSINEESIDSSYSSPSKPSSSYSSPNIPSSYNNQHIGSSYIPPSHSPSSSPKPSSSNYNQHIGSSYIPPSKPSSSSIYEESADSSYIPPSKSSSSYSSPNIPSSNYNPPIGSSYIPPSRFTPSSSAQPSLANQHIGSSYIPPSKSSPSSSYYSNSNLPSSHYNSPHSSFISSSSLSNHQDSDSSKTSMYNTRPESSILESHNSKQRQNKPRPLEGNYQSFSNNNNKDSDYGNSESQSSRSSTYNEPQNPNLVISSSSFGNSILPQAKVNNNEDNSHNLQQENKKFELSIEEDEKEKEEEYHNNNNNNGFFPSDLPFPANLETSDLWSFENWGKRL